MRERSAILANPRVKPIGKAWNGIDMCEVTTMTGKLTVGYAADEDGWEHVSVSPKGSKRESILDCPSWRQMSDVRNIFWKPDELVLQLHPPEADYFHGPGFDSNILHLWRPVGGDWSMLAEKDSKPRDEDALQIGVCQNRGKDGVGARDAEKGEQAGGGENAEHQGAE